MSIKIKCDGAACTAEADSQSPFHISPPLGWGSLTFARERPGVLDAGTAALRDMVEAGAKVDGNDPRLGSMRKALKSAELRVAPELVTFTAQLCPGCTAKIPLDAATVAEPE